MCASQLCVYRVLMSFCMLTEWLRAIHHEGPMSQLTAHTDNRIQG